MAENPPNAQLDAFLSGAPRPEAAAGTAGKVHAAGKAAQGAAKASGC